MISNRFDGLRMHKIMIWRNNTSSFLQMYRKSKQMKSLKLVNCFKRSHYFQVPPICAEKTGRQFKRESRTIRRTRDWTPQDMMTVFCAKAYDPNFKFHWGNSYVFVLAERKWKRIKKRNISGLVVFASDILCSVWYFMLYYFVDNTLGLLPWHFATIKKLLRTRK